jgi:uncharacterized protein
VSGRPTALSLPAEAIEDHLAAVAWDRVNADLDEKGFAIIEALLNTAECRSVAGLYRDDSRFRSRIVMARHGFGRGEYKYFANPLPPLVSCLRREVYPYLAPLANRWNEVLKIGVRYPAILLSEPALDFTGGEFVLTEQRPRMQSRASVVPLRQGDAVIFAVHHRPVQGGRGPYRVNLRHGVSEVRSGKRYTLGIIFHDAK